MGGHAVRMDDPAAATRALENATHPVTQALLLPFAPAATLAKTTPAIEPVVVDRLRIVSPTSPLHLTLVEAVRRQYRHFKQAEDRRDKDAVRARAAPPRS